MKSILLAAVVGLMGCGPKPTSQMADGIDMDDRYVLTRLAVIEDDLAYNNRRGIYELWDKDTGKSFIGISGIGIAENGIHQSGKIRIRDER